MASDTHKDAELASARADPAAVKKIREFTGNNLSHEEAKRLLVECDGDVQVALNRIADGLESWNEVKEKPKKEKTVKKREDGAPSGRGRGRGGSRGGRGGHRPEGGAAPAANGGSPHPERSGRGGRGRGSERGGATQRPVSASAPGAAPAQAPKQPAAPQAAPAQPAPQVARAPIPPPTRHPGMTAAQIVAGAHLQQQQQAAQAQAQAQAQAHAHAHAPAHAQQPAQAAASSHQPASHSPATTAAHAHEAHPGHSAPAQVAPAHAPAPAAQTHAAPVSQAPAVAPTTQQTAAAAAAPAPAAKTESASAAPAVANAGAAPGATAPAASNGRPPRQQNGKAKEGGGRAPRHEAQATSPSTASKNPVVVLPSSVAHNSGDFQFGSFSMTPLSDNLPAVQAQPAAKPAQSRPQQAAVQAPAPAHQQVHHQQPAHQHHQAHVTETSAQSVRPEAAYHHSHETHAAEQPVEEAGIPQIPPGYMGYPPFMPVPFAYDGDTGRMHPAYYEHPAAFGAPYRAASGSPVGESALNKLGSPQHLLDQSAQQSAAAGNATAQPTAQHGGAYNSQQFLPAGFHYYPPYGGQFYPPAGYTNPRAYKPAAYMGSYPGATQGYGAPEPEEAYGSKYAPHGGYNPAGSAQTTGKPNQSQFASPPAAPIDPYKQDFASKAYNSRDTSAQAYPYQAAYHQAYYPMHMPSYGQPQGQASQPSGRGGNQ